METRFLLPNKFKKIGLIAMVPSFILGVFSMFNISIIKWKIHAMVLSFVHQDILKEKTEFFKFTEANIYTDIVGITLLISLVFVAFSKEKYEDEYIAKIRLESLVWATYVNYAIILLCFIFIYGLVFLDVMVVNLYSILLLFIIRFNYQLYKTRKMAAYEK